MSTPPFMADNHQNEGEDTNDYFFLLHQIVNLSVSLEPTKVIYTNLMSFVIAFIPSFF
jgi:hypothetical protein